VVDYRRDHRVEAIRASDHRIQPIRNLRLLKVDAGRCAVTLARGKIESIAETKLAEEAIRLIRDNAKITELAKARDALSANIQSGARLSIIFPEKVKDVEMYHEFTAWWYGSKDSDKTIADAGLPKFAPSSEERKKYERLISGEITEFTIPCGGNLRAFRMVQTPDGKMILLIDTSRRSEYSRGSF